MTNEELNTALYDKMFEEQEQFRGWLLGLPPEEILNHAGEYISRENLLMAVEHNDLTDKQAKALLASDHPLKEAYTAFECMESDYYMEDVFSCVESAAESLIREQILKNKVPLYRFPAEYAHEHGELDAYRSSFQANVVCREEIESAIVSHYDGSRLDTGCVKDLIDRFGYERVEYVLATTVRLKDIDGRLSPDNKMWAKTVPSFEDMSFIGDRRFQYVVDRCHVGLTDLFVTAFRKELKQREQAQEPPKRESVLAMLEQPIPDPPARAPQKPKSMERG